MNWQKELRSWVLASAGTFCLLAVGVTLLRVPRMLQPLLTRTDAVLSNVEAASGQWSAASKAQAAAMTAIERDIRVDTWHIDRFVQHADESLTLMTGNVDATLGDAGTLLRTTNATVAGVQPVLASADRLLSTTTVTVSAVQPVVQDVDAFITSPELKATTANAAAVTASAAAITQEGAAVAADGRRVADKLTTDYLRPVPWYLWPAKRFGEIWDVAAAVARHTP